MAKEHQDLKALRARRRALLDAIHRLKLERADERLAFYVQGKPTAPAKRAQDEVLAARLQLELRMTEDRIKAYDIAKLHLVREDMLSALTRILRERGLGQLLEEARAAVDDTSVAQRAWLESAKPDPVSEQAKAEVSALCKGVA